LIATALLFAAAPLHAQNWTVGLKGGIGQASFTGQQEFEWKAGALSAVGFLNRKLTSRLSIQPEIYETQRIGTSTAGGGDLTFNAHYVDFPILLRYRLPGVGTLRPFAVVGPHLSFVASCGLSFVAPGIASNFQCGEAANTFDYGVSGGAGLAWGIRSTTVTVEARGSENVRSVVLSSKSSRGVAYAVLAGASVPLSTFFRKPRLGAVPGQSGSIGLPPNPEVALGPSLPTLAYPTPLGVDARQRVTVSAVGADARTLLVEIAKEAGISLVVSNDVQRRVTVSLNDAPADEAIRAIVAQAGLSIVQPASSQLPPVVFYQLPVNVNAASADAIAARFGVSREMAQYIADSRANPPKP